MLRSVDLIAAEDTRRTRKLLSAHEIRARCVSLHASSTESRVTSVIDHLLRGHDVAYVTDAGCPVISDPGVALVNAAHTKAIPVRTVPGASALTSALAISGLPSAVFRFLGFLPRQRGRRRSILKEASLDGSALVLFESPTRVRALLSELADIIPERTVAACRELTKIYEEVIRGSPEDVLTALTEEPRGEFTVIIGAVEGPSLPTSPPDEETLIEHARQLRARGLSTSQAARVLSSEAGVPRKKAYRLILDDESKNGD